MQTNEDEVFALFRRWCDNETRLRVDSKLGVINFSLEGFLERAEERLVGFRLPDVGFIEFLFDESWTYEFLAPDSMRIPRDERIADSSTRNHPCEYGEVVKATRHTGSAMYFMEIVQKLEN